MLSHIARLASTHPSRIVLATLAFALFAGVLGGPVAGVMKAGSDNFEDPASESVAARHVLERAGGASAEPDLLALVRPGAPVRSTAGSARVGEVARQVAGEKGVARVMSFPATGDPALVSRDGSATYLAAYFRGSSAGAKDDTAKRLDERLAMSEGSSSEDLGWQTARSATRCPPTSPAPSS